MIIQFIIIGNEILNGKIADANLSWLARFLVHKNLPLSKALVAPDKREDLVPLLQKAFAESDILIVSGGLGPTNDDITKEVLGLAMGRSLVYQDKAHSLMVSQYLRAKLPVPDQNHPYSYLPQDFSPVPNPCGLANGLQYYDSQKGKLLLSAPGVPREFQEMVTQEFIPLIETFFPQPRPLQRAFIARTRFVPEEKIFKKIDPDLWNTLGRWGEVSSLPHTLGVDIGVHLTGASENEIRDKENSLRQIITQSPVAEFIWQIGSESLAQFVVSLCREKNLTFSFAESCTGGHLSSQITDIPGSSEVFRGGIVSYQTTVKENLLGVSRQTLERFGVVSREMALEMALGVKSLLKTNLSLSTTGLAGPGGGGAETPVGTVAIGVCNGDKATSHQLQFQGDRKRLKDVFTQRALHFLLDEIRGQE